MLRLRILKTYFLEILLLFTIVILTTIAMLSWFLNVHFERSTSTMVNALNQEFLAESHRINDYLQKMIKISGMELFFEPSIQRLMYQEHITNFDVVTGIRRLDAVMSTNIHTQSIYVYNAANRYMYATSNVDSDRIERFKDQGVLELLSGSADHRRLAPIPRYAETPSGTTPVYSFVFYDIQKTDPRISGALIMNISLEWLREVFKDTLDSQSSIVFVDTDGTVAYHTDPAYFLQNMSDQNIFKQMAGTNSLNGYFLHQDAEGKSYVFFSRSEDSPLYLMRIYPYESIMQGIVDMRATTLLLVFLCVIVALLLGFLISRRLYRPIHQLVRRVEQDNREALYEQGELGFLSTSIDRMLSQAESFEETTESYRRLLQVDVLREILMGKVGDPDLVAGQLREYGFPFDPDQPLQLIAMKPCDESAWNAICSGESLPAMFAVPYDGSRTLVVAQHCLGTALDALCKNAFAHGVELIVLQRRIEHPYQLSSQAIPLLEQLRFSFLYEPKRILDERVPVRNSSGGTYPTEIENALLHLLHQGRALEAFERYEEFFELVSCNSFSHFRFSMKRLYISMQLLVKELQGVGCFGEYREMGIAEFESFIENLTSKSTLDEYFLRWCERFEDELQRCKTQKNQALVEQVKQVVEHQYANPNLCLQFLADEVRLSASYVSKLFKECEGVSVSDYVQERRMREVVRQLAETEIPVKEIASSVGFTNENYFYTVFKKVHGMTPNEYRKRSRLQ